MVVRQTRRELEGHPPAGRKFQDVETATEHSGCTAMMMSDQMDYTEISKTTDKSG